MQKLHEIKGELAVRALVGGTIAVPVAAAFCAAYLITLGLETVRDAAAAHRVARHKQLTGETRLGLIAKAA